MFATKEKSYAEMDDEAAFIQFVERIEEIIEAENSATLKVMSTLSDTRAKPSTADNSKKHAEGI